MKNPLGAIELGLQLLQKKIENGSPLDKTGGTIMNALRATASMKNLILTLLDQAKMEAGSFALDFQNANLGEVVENVRTLLTPLAEQRDIQIETNTKHPIPRILLDSARLNQVISNILGNAIKFTPEGGKITIETSVESQNIQVSISDTGPGIPEDQKQQVFERFWQARETHQQGTGLGLAIAKGIVEAHHGKIWIESEVGKGSTFFFSLPIRRLSN